MDSKNYVSSSLVGKLTILSGVIAFVSYFLVAAGFNFHFELFSNPSLVFETVGINTNLLRWSMNADIFGYYLLLLPLLIFLHLRMKNSFSWSPVTNLCGIAYIMIGSIGAAVLAILWPMHIDTFSNYSIQQQETSRLIFISFTGMVVEGMWNLLNSFFACVWFLGIGIFLRSKHKVIALLTIVVSVICFLDFLGNALALKSLAEMALNAYLVLAPIWAIVIGTRLIFHRTLNI